MENPQGTPPPEYVSSLAVTMNGLFNTLALSEQRGATKLTSGKIPLPFEVYSKLSKWLLEQNKHLKDFLPHFF